MAYLARILVYPLKSFDPLACSKTCLLPSGALAHDREFALFDAEGKVINGKRTPLIHGLRVLLDPRQGALCLAERATGRSQIFYLPDDQAAVEHWLGEYFGQPIRLQRNGNGGFPDDKNAPGPTVVSTATLQEVASWFPGVSVESMRIRFRANLEIDGVPAFWEDRLFGEPETTVPFQIGHVAFQGTNPCQRCVVPPRDPETGDPIPEFSQIFRARREETLPSWSCRTRFNHFYRLAVNTRVPETEAGKTLHVGDPVILA